MKLLDQMQPGENLSWCAPHKITRKADGAVAWLISNERDVAGIDFSGNCIDSHKCNDIGDMLALLGYSEDDLYESIDFKEMGCTDCPFCSECEAVQEESVE